MLLYLVVNFIVVESTLLDPIVGSSWENVDNDRAFKVISTGQAGVWAIQNDGTIFVRETTYNYGTLSMNPIKGTDWIRIPGPRMIDISVGYNIVWATDVKHHIFVRRGINSTYPYGTKWDSVIGRMKRISVSSRTNVAWGIYSNGFVLTRQGIPDVTGDGDLAGKRWFYIPGMKLRFITVSDIGVWGLSFKGYVIYRVGTRESSHSRGTNWKRVPGPIMKQISGGYDILWGVDRQNVVYYRKGISNEMPTGTRWVALTRKLQYIATNTLDASVWGLTSNSVLLRSNTQLVNMGYSPWTTYGECNQEYGYRYRLRYCIENTARNVDCSFETIEFKKCQQLACE